MLQLVLDEPPTDLENKWRDDRVKYYQRVEPTEPPRDEAPVLIHASKRPRALRLEDEASNRMWELLLKDDEINFLQEKTKHEEIMEHIKESSTSMASDLPKAEDITDPLLKLLVEDKYSEESGRITHTKVWVDTKGPGLTGHASEKMKPGNVPMPM